MTHVRIINKREVINGLLYQRHVVTNSGNKFGLPVGVYVEDNRGKFIVIAYRQTSSTKTTESFRVINIDYSELEAELCCAINFLVSGTAPARTINLRENKQQRINCFDIQTPPGICLKTVADIYVQLKVSYFDSEKLGFKTKTFHCGGLDNWESRYLDKLEAAIAFREKSLREFVQLTTLPRST